jgi:DNA polymerase III alpha subunit
MESSKKGTNHMNEYTPLAKIPEPFTCADDYLEAKCRQTVLQRFGTASNPVQQEALDLLEAELETIRKAEIANTILLVEEMVRWVRKESFQIVLQFRPDRSLVMFLLGLSPINPLNLQSGEKRACTFKGMISCDFSGKGAERAREYLIQTYGCSNVHRLIGACIRNRLQPLDYMIQLHSCAFAISKEPLKKILYMEDGMPVFTGSPRAAKKSGLVVFALLSLSPLEQISESLKIAHNHCSEANRHQLDLMRIDLDDKETYRLTGLAKWQRLHNDLFNTEFTNFSDGEPPHCFNDLVVRLNRPEPTSIKAPGAKSELLYPLKLFWSAYLQTWIDGERLVEQQ